MTDDPIPAAKVKEIAEQFRQLRDLEARKAATQAELIRWCVRTLKQTPDDAKRSLEAAIYKAHRKGERFQPLGGTALGKKVRDDKAKALLYLEWLATQLENQSVRSPDNIERKD